MMDPREAALSVLGASPGEEMHWTVVWDRALRERLIDPITDPEARNAFLRALADLAREGRITKTSGGTYRAEGPTTDGLG